jgi:uncharacterized protein (UPF0276 family)
MIGIGLRFPHYAALLKHLSAASTQDAPLDPTLGLSLDFIEVHAENFFSEGGPHWQRLKSIATHLPISLHGVGMGLASPEPLNKTHLNRYQATLQRLVDYQGGNPNAVILCSEHACWNHWQGQYFNDLLPFPFTPHLLNTLSDHVDAMQNALGRTILIENLSAYIQFAEPQMAEHDFLMTLCQRTGCQLLLDINNLYVNQCNFGIETHNAAAFIQACSPDTVGEIHLAGHLITDDGVIDHHGSAVCDAVWQLYQDATTHLGITPTLIEWDTDIPSLDVLLNEAQKARTIQQHYHTMPLVTLDQTS